MILTFTDKGGEGHEPPNRADIFCEQSLTWSYFDLLGLTSSYQVLPGLTGSPDVFLEGVQHFFGRVGVFFFKYLNAFTVIQIYPHLLQFTYKVDQKMQTPKNLPKNEEKKYFSTACDACDI